MGLYEQLIEAEQARRKVRSTRLTAHDSAEVRDRKERAKECHQRIEAARHDLQVLKEHRARDAMKRRHSKVKRRDDQPRFKELQRVIAEAQAEYEEILGVESYDIAFYEARHALLKHLAENRTSEDSAMVQQLVSIAGVPEPYASNPRLVWMYTVMQKNGVRLIHLFFGGGSQQLVDDNTVPDGLGHAHYVLKQVGDELVVEYARDIDRIKYRRKL